MKWIIADFLRRWWGGYLLAVPFLGGMAAAMDLEGSFAFVGLSMLPFMFELGRRPVGVMTILPVSRKTIALSYWCLGLLWPMLLMTGTVTLVGLLSPSVVILSKNFAVMLFGSLAVAGSSYCFFTFILPDERGDDAGNFAVMLMLGLWVPATIFGSFLPKFFDTANQSPVAYLGAGLLGLLLTFLGYLRSEKLVTGPTRKRPGRGPYSAQAPTRIPAPKPGMARFGGVFFDGVRSWIPNWLALPGILADF